MEIDKDTILLYMREAKAKIELIETDMQAYEYRLKQSVKEINTLKYLIGTYEKALEMLDNKGKLHAQEDHAKGRKSS